MIHGRLYRADNQSCLVPKASRTTNTFERMRGLLGRARINSDEGLIIKPCSSVHTFGMKFAIDLAFLDNNWLILKTVSRLKPWRMAFCAAASMVLELPVDDLDRLQLTTGQKLQWHDDEIQ